MRGAYHFPHRVRYLIGGNESPCKTDINALIFLNHDVLRDNVLSRYPRLGSLGALS